MPLLPLQKALGPVTASRSRWAKFASNPLMRSSFSSRLSYQAPLRLHLMKPAPRPFSELRQPSLLLKGNDKGLIASSITPKIPFRIRVSSFAFGSVLTVVVLSGSLYVYYRSFFARVPVTNRERMLWYDKNYEEELGWAAESWILSQQNARPRLEEDSAVVNLAREILAKLLEGSELAKDLQLKLYVVDDYLEPYACSTPGLEGGRIFINTGELFVCESVDEIAGVMAHELGHIIARHIPERRAAELFARKIAGIFGWNAALGHDLISWRIQEKEADHIGLILMAQAGFDPKARIEYFEKHHEKEKKMLNGRDPMPESMSTHPSHENRVKTMKTLLPEAKAIFGKKPSATPSIIETWEAARVVLVEGYQSTVAQVEAAQQMAPEALLQRIDERMARLENAFADISAAFLMKDWSNKDVLGMILEVAARKQKEAGAQSELGRAEEGAVEQRTAEEGSLEDAIPKEAVHAIPLSEGVSGLKEAATQTTLTANVSRPPIEEKDGSEGQ